MEKPRQYTKPNGEVVVLLTPQWFSDPGHEWLRVSYNELKKLGIHKEITPYSFRRGDQCFLEGDCDVEKYFNARIRVFVEQMKGEFAPQVRTNGDAVCRRYRQYRGA